MTSTKNKIQKRLFQAIDDSLALLNQASIKEQKPAVLEESIPSLLDQCINLCEQHSSQTQEPIRVIHHFGLPLDSLLLSSLATIPNTQVLDGILSKKNRFDDCVKTQVFREKKIGLYSDEKHREKDSEYQNKVLLSELDYIQKENKLLGQRLLICDNYCRSQTGSIDTDNLSTVLSREFKVYSVIVVYDPVDAYLAYSIENAQKEESTLSFSEYCLCVFNFIKANPELLIVHHETFVTDAEMVMSTIGYMLDLPICDDFSLLREIFSGNKKGVIDSCLLDSLDTSKEYKKLCELLGYKDRFDTHVDENKSSQVYSLKSDAFYKKKSRECIKKESSPFILLDSKSMPRSGLHYMAKTFEQVLGSNFSFCEWYQEQGCCKKMPCELTGFATHNQCSGEVKIRLIKSHDFGLSDPDFMPSYSARRVILIRKPLYILTSLFLLDQLSKYSKELKIGGISLQKIWLKHEPEVLTMAYEVLDKIFIGPSSDVLAEWLDEKIKYLNDFIKKWVKPTDENPHQYKQVVFYEKINEYIEDIFLEIYDYLPSEKKRNINQYIENSQKNFLERSDPFDVQSKKVSDFLIKNSNEFIKAAVRVDYFN